MHLKPQHIHCKDRECQLLKSHPFLPVDPSLHSLLNHFRRHSDDARCHITNRGCQNRNKIVQTLKTGRKPRRSHLNGILGALVTCYKDCRRRSGNSNRCEEPSVQFRDASVSHHPCHALRQVAVLPPHFCRSLAIQHRHNKLNACQWNPSKGNHCQLRQWNPTILLDCSPNP